MRHNKQHLPHASSFIVVAKELKVKAANHKRFAKSLSPLDRQIAMAHVDSLKDIADTLSGEAKRVRSLR